MLRIRRVIIFSILAFINCQCEQPITPNRDPVFEIEVLKWYEGHQAAVSITYDAPWGFNSKLQDAVDEVVNRNLRMDFEMVTANFNRPGAQYLIEQMRAELLPNGIHFFGHGHKHDNHDLLTFEAAYASLKQCYDLMKVWGLNPKAYGYPYSAGSKDSTQLASKLAGFLCARGGTYNKDEYYICANEEIEPQNWYFLPSIPVSSEVNLTQPRTHAEMAPLFDAALQKSAWIIVMYHNIGIPEGYAYYPFDDFKQDLDYIADNDFWSANLDIATLYVQEKNKLQF